MRLPFAALFEPRATEARGIRLPDQFTTVSDLLSMGPAVAAGVSVTPERAISVPAVYASISVLAQDVARTPIKLRRRVAADTFEDATDHALWEILHDLANPETTAFDLKRQLQTDLLLHEHAYAQIVRVDNRVTALWRLDPTRMVVERDAALRKRWRYTDDRGKTHEWLFDASQPPIFELTHPSPIRACRDLIGTAIALERYIGRFFGNGARMGGTLETDIPDLDEDQFQQIRQRLEGWHAGVEQAHRLLILSAGMKYQAVAAPNDTAQLNELYQTIRTEIAGVFRVPTWRIGDLSRATYSNMESGERSYVEGSLDPLFALWEAAIRRDLLTTRQFGQFTVAFDRAALIRNDIKTLHEALARGRDAGYYSANDIRRKLGENPISAEQGGDLYLCNGNLTPLTQAGSATAAE